MAYVQFKLWPYLSGEFWHNFSYGRNWLFPCGVTFSYSRNWKTMFSQPIQFQNGTHSWFDFRELTEPCWPWADALLR